MRNIDRDEQFKADQTVKTLESQALDIDAEMEQLQVHELGELIRQSSSHNLPDASVELRQMLIQELDDAVPAANSLPKPKRAKDKTPGFWRTIRAPLAVAAAATLMLAAFSWLNYESETTPWKLADGTILKYQSGSPQSPLPPQAALDDPAEEKFKPEKKPKIEYRMETRTRAVPVTRTRQETRTRQVPVQRIRKEKKQRKLANGKFEEYEVNVPYTDMVTQNYTVTVPYTENISQSYAVPVPYVVDESAKEFNKLSEEKLVSPDAEEWRRKLVRRKKYEDLRLSFETGLSSTSRKELTDNEIREKLPSVHYLKDDIQYAEQYAPIQENQFVRTLGESAISTFSIDVDTAAYANMRRFINNGQMPPPDSVRIEELINYFQYDYPQPDGEDPFSVNMELANCPWDQSHKLLRVGLKGKEVHVDERPATNIVFLLDVSGSMNNEDKLPLLKRGFKMMVNQLNENDRVAIVTYAGNAGVVLEPISGDQTKKINDAIDSLTPGGSTHGSAGIELAYQLAQKHFIKDGANKVILATDGDLNVGITEDEALVKLIKQKQLKTYS